MGTIEREWNRDRVANPVEVRGPPRRLHLEICFEHSCYFTTDGGEWPFSISRKKLEETFIHGGGI